MNILYPSIGQKGFEAELSQLNIILVEDG